MGESKYSPINGRLSKFSISIFSIKNSVVLYKIGFPGTSNSPALSTNPLDSNVLIDDSDSTPLISDIFNFVTGCSYAIIANVYNAGVYKPFITEGGFTSFK